MEKEELEKWQRAFNILKEVIQESGLKDVSEYQGEPLELRWHVFKRDYPGDFAMVMHISGLYGTLDADFRLIKEADTRRNVHAGESRGEFRQVL